MGVPNVLNAELQCFMEAELCFVLVRPLMDLFQHHSHSSCGNFSQFKCIYIACFNHNCSRGLYGNLEPDPQASTSGRNNFPYNRKNLWAGPGPSGGILLLIVGWIKEKGKRENSNSTLFYYTTPLFQASDCFRTSQCLLCLFTRQPDKNGDNRNKILPDTNLFQELFAITSLFFVLSMSGAGLMGIEFLYF